MQNEQEVSCHIRLTIEPKDVGEDGINPPSGWPQGRALGRK